MPIPSNAATTASHSRVAVGLLEAEAGNPVFRFMAMAPMEETGLETVPHPQFQAESGCSSVGNLRTRTMNTSVFRSPERRS